MGGLICNRPPLEDQDDDDDDDDVTSTETVAD
jgi:hypothetical protein